MPLVICTLVLYDYFSNLKGKDFTDILKTMFKNDLSFEPISQSLYTNSQLLLLRYTEYIQVIKNRYDHCT